VRTTAVLDRAKPEDLATDTVTHAIGTLQRIRDSRFREVTRFRPYRATSGITTTPCGESTSSTSEPGSSGLCAPLADPRSHLVAVGQGQGHPSGWTSRSVGLVFYEINP
jgi:hypothetical protein